MRFSIRILLSLVAIALASGGASAQSDNLRIGFLTVRTGPLAAGGKQMEDGINLFLKERNYTLSGRKVEIIFADTAGQPAQAKTKAQELVERDKVNVLVGPLATFEALALDDYVLQAKVPLLPPMSAAQNDLAQQRKSDYVIHTYGTAAQAMYAMGDYAAKKLGFSHRRITSGAGHDACNLNTRIPAAMVFVPCKDGVSHNELEDATQADCTAGANVLMHTVLALAGVAS